MAKQCPHCEMESDRDEYCTFCGKLIETTEPGPPGKSQAPPSGKRPASPVPPGAAPRGPSAEAGPAKTGAPAKRAPAKIERGRPAWVYYVAVVVGLIVLYVFACFALAFTASSPPDEAADWKRIETKTKQMSIEAPGNWDCTLSGSEGSFEFVTVRAGKTYTVTMRGTQAKGSIGDIGAATAQAMSGSSE
ncbi:MAG TPA: hypothetical protein QGH10_14665, partial [Armatimonadota bacterium]|nr:hypothetical protein [Armatimonadota bacterium]